MWRFEHISTLWWWLLIPVTILLIGYLRAQRDKRISGMGNPQKVRALISHLPAKQLFLKRTLWYIAILLIVMAMANLQTGQEEESVTNRGANVVIALDLSNSMLAQDVAPNRLERSKKFLTDLVSELGGDRVAFIVFAGKAYIQMPFTTDYGAFEMQLKAVSTDMMPTQGTAIGEAIGVAESLTTPQNSKQKIMILLSDGEDHDSKAIAAAKKASSRDMIIHTIGVGTSEGAPIPEKSSNGNLVYMRDKDGNQVVTKINEKELEEIASAGSGKYFNIQNERRALREIKRSIKWAKNNTGEQKTYARYKNYFQWFLFPAILILMIELAGVHLLTFREKKVKTLILLLGMLPLWSSCKKSPNETIRDEQDAFQAYQRSDFASALKIYKEVAKKDSSAKSNYNIAVSLSKLLKQDSAIIYYRKVLESQKDTQVIAQTYFNQGCLQYAKKDFKNASESFKNALRWHPDNFRAQYNLSLTLLHLPPQNQSQNQKNPDQNQKNNPNQDQNNKQNPDQKKNQDQDKKDKQDQKNKDKSQQQNPQKNDSQENKDKNDQKPQDQTPKNEQQNGQLSPQDVKRLFQALDQQERAVQRKVLKQKGNRSGRSYIEKDW